MLSKNFIDCHLMLRERDLSQLSVSELDDHFAEITKRVTETRVLSDGSPPFSMSLISIIDREENAGEVSLEGVANVIKRKGGREISFEATKLITQYRKDKDDKRLSEVAMELHAWLGGWMDSHQFFREDGKRSEKVKRYIEGAQISAREVESVFYSGDTVGFFEAVIDSFGLMIDEHLDEKSHDTDSLFPVLLETNPENKSIYGQRFFRKVRLPNGDSVLHTNRDLVVYKSNHDELRKDPIAIINYQFSDNFDVNDIRSLISAYIQALCIRQDVVDNDFSFGKKPHTPKRDITNVVFCFRHFNRSKSRFDLHYVNLSEILSNTNVLNAIYDYQVNIALNYSELNKKRANFKKAVVLPHIPLDKNIIYDSNDIRRKQRRLVFSN